MRRIIFEVLSPMAVILLVDSFIGISDRMFILWYVIGYGIISYFVDKDKKDIRNKKNRIIISSCVSLLALIILMVLKYCLNNSFEIVNFVQILLALVCSMGIVYTFSIILSIRG